MIGYGPEDDNFVLELTYNYGVGGYKLGNDLVGIQIESKAAYQKVLKNEQNWIFMHKDPETLVISSPANYLFEIRNPEHEQDLITKVALSSSNLSKSRQYWHELLGMKVLEESDRSLKLAYDPKEARLELVGTNGREVKRETAYGRMAFACAEDALTPLQEKVLEQKQTVLTKLVSLDTPGKATVQVVILADPDGHEICFVGEKGFSDLSQVDPKANELLEEVSFNICVCKAKLTFEFCQTLGYGEGQER